MKDQLAEIIGRGHYGLYNWDRIKFGQFPDVSLEDARWVFDTAEELCKLLFPEGEKPPVITHQAVLDWLKKRDGDLDLYTQYTISPDEHKEAQRDADVAYYEPLKARQEMLEEVIKLIDDLQNKEEAFVDDVDFRQPHYKGKPMWDTEGMAKKLEHSKQTYKKIKDAVQSLKVSKGGT